MTARSSRISRRASLRAPFVTAVAAGALVSACGGRADVVIGDAGPGSDANANTDSACTHCNPPPTNQCPTAAPTSGVACSASGAECTYEDDCAPGGTVTYTCTSGTWAPQRGSTPKTVACPATQPADGSSCFVCNGTYPAQCEYDECYGSPRTAICNPTTLLWEVSSGSCNPPPPPPQDAGTEPSDASTEPSDAPHDAPANPPGPPVEAGTNGGG